MTIGPNESVAGMLTLLDDKELKKQGKYVRERAIYDYMVTTLNDIGRLVSLNAMSSGTVPAHVDHDGKVRLLVPKDMEAAELLYKWFGWDKSSDWVEKFGNYLTGSEIISPCAMRRAFHYDAANHLLYLNEFNRRYLKIDREGRIERKVNGDGGLVFMELEDSAHHTDLDSAASYAGPAWDVGPDSLWVRYVFDVATFEGRIDQVTARGLLMGFILSLAFKDRVRSVPVVHFHSGLSGTLKTAVGTAIGWVLCGLDFLPTLTPSDRKEAENCLINAPGYILLDESNDLRQLQDMLKSVVTGGCIRRRRYYFTAAEEKYIVDCGVFLTTNSLSVSEDAVTARILQFNTAPVSAFHSEFEIKETWRKNNVREGLWNELVGRCAAAMREISRAEETSAAHLQVSHRMSSFFVFLRMLARQEGCEQKALDVIQAVSDRQNSTMADQDDLTPLVKQAIESSQYNGEWMIARDWSRLLKLHADLIPGGMGVSLSKLLSSALALSNRFRSSQALHKLGMETRTPKGEAMQFRFPKSEKTQC
jgi:hypothetical protein